MQKQGEKKPCNIIGSVRTYWEGKADDPVYAEFQKAYKRNHYEGARVLLVRKIDLNYENWSSKSK